jgi:hypothetical protein
MGGWKVGGGCHVVGMAPSSTFGKICLVPEPAILCFVKRNPDLGAGMAPALDVEVRS